MVGWRVCWVWVALVGAIGAEARAAAAPATRPAGPPWRAVAMQLHRVDWQAKYKKGIERIAATGADAVLFVVDCQAEHQGSTRLYLDRRRTPARDQLNDLIQHARDYGLRVMLMPIVTLDRAKPGEWRGTYRPPSWEDWFDSYRGVLRHFAYSAAEMKVDVFFVGSELSYMEHRTEDWRKTIAVVREIYKGKLAYSANWDHYEAVTFWDQLDFVAMNSYWKLGDDHEVTDEQIADAWRRIQGEVLAYCRKQGKPLLLTEVGWCSKRDAASEPWQYDFTGAKLDMDLQRRLYEGFFKAWHGRPELAGFAIWAYAEESGPEDKGYTPWGKPAMRVLREWLAKPRWEVR